MFFAKIHRSFNHLAYNVKYLFLNKNDIKTLVSYLYGIKVITSVLTQFYAKLETCFLEKSFFDSKNKQSAPLYVLSSFSVNAINTNLP